MPFKRSYGVGAISQKYKKKLKIGDGYVIAARCTTDLIEHIWKFQNYSGKFALYILLCLIMNIYYSIFFSEQLMELFPCRARRRISHGLKRKPLGLIKRLRKAKKEAGPLEKPEVN